MDDLIVEFITETSESLSTLDLELVKLEKNPQDDEILGNIFRIMHTIKGTCGFLGLPRLEHVAHASENVLGKIRDRELEASSDAVTIILESLDNIKRLIDYLSEYGEEEAGSDSDLIDRLNKFAETGVIDNSSCGSVTSNSESQAKDNVVNDDSIASGDDFPHFKGEDDPSIIEALERMAAEEKASKLGENSSPSDVTESDNTGDISMESMSSSDQHEEAVNDSFENDEAISVVKNGKAPKSEEENIKKQPTAKSGESVQSIRVGIDVLESLMQMVSELVLTRNQLMQIVRMKDDKELVTPLQQLSHITSELQEGVMKTRMQPIGNGWSKFPRLIRDLSIDLGKKIDLKMVGADTELDRQLLDVIKDPLTHMVRNSCDHGLETPEERKAAGKSEVGTVSLSAYHEGGHIIIEITDDGRGINIDRVKKKAIANGIATEEELSSMSEKQIAQFVFAPGFSTAEKVTSVSGRGVGMDVVKTNIQKIGGTIDLESRFGKGSKIAVKIPLTLAIVSVLIVEAQGQKLAVPQINVIELVRAAPGSGVELEMINDSLVMRLRDKLLPLAVMTEVLGFSCDHNELINREAYIVVCRVGSYDFGILVDKVYDTEEIVVKPVSDILKTLSIYSGNTILGDGSVIMILDPNGIARTISSTDIGAKSEDVDVVQSMESSQNTIGFLSFTLGDGAPKAVPLELISRLEEINVKDIEVAGDKPVVQYRGDLMRLITLDDDFSMPDNGAVDVIVFGYDKKVIGLVVDEIVDIVQAPFDIKLSSKDAKRQGYLGSMVILGKTTDIVDIGYLLSDLVGEVVADSNSIGKQQAENKSILLVEDSPFFRNLTVPMLSAVGYNVSVAENGRDALNILSKQDKKFDVIVTDIEMPVMDGFDFVSACRNNTNINGTPIVGYTASLSSEVVQRSKEVGMNDCIVKTDRPGLLGSIAHWVLGHKEVA
ncbi:MAG: chemotaxis protein CheW [Rickettsiales bacterium]